MTSLSRYRSVRYIHGSLTGQHGEIGNVENHCEKYVKLVTTSSIDITEIVTDRCSVGLFVT